MSVRRKTQAALRRRARVGWIGPRSRVEFVKDIAGDQSAELVAIAESDPALVAERKRSSRQREVLYGLRGDAGPGEAGSGDRRDGQ